VREGVPRSPCLQQGASKRRTRVCLEENAWSSRSQLDLSWHRDHVFEARHLLVMAVACGGGFTTIVTEEGGARACGNGEDGQLGLGDTAHQLLPSHVGGRKVFAGEPLVMISAGSMHTASVSKNGVLWSWGDGRYGQLGHGDREPRQRPERLSRDMFGGSPAMMVACGGVHMLVLTAVGLVWSCGAGANGRLGHGNEADELVLKLVAAERFRGAQIVMVVAGGGHSVALEAEGMVWTWGVNNFGQLGHNDSQNRLVPTQLAGEALGGSATVLVAAGSFHTVAVMIDGALWAWGFEGEGQLGLDNTWNMLVPARVGAEDEFGGLPVLMAACGDSHSLAVTKTGTLWSWGEGDDGKLGHNNKNIKLVATKVETQHFGDSRIVSATTGETHSAAVTEHGELYTWGLGTFLEEEEEEEEKEEGPGGLGHGDFETKWVPTLVAPALLHGARVGCCHGLPPLHALAFAMGNHSRLGSATQTAPAAADKSKDCEYVSMPGELVQRIVEACGVWPEGRAGELEGVVRLLGGGMIDDRGSM